MLGGLAEHLGIQAAQAPAVAQPLLGVLPRDVLGAPPGLLGGELDLVVPRLVVVGEVADVGDVDDVGDAQPLGEQRALEQVGEEVRAHVADVLVRVDGRPAGVDARVARLEGLEDLLAPGPCVVEAERGSLAHLRSSSSTTAWAAMPSPRPIAPRRSVLVTLTLIRSGAAPSSRASSFSMGSR